MKTSEKTGCRLLPLKVFWGGVLIYLLAVLPFLVYRRGLFFYYGDYNVQQVPFLIYAHRAVREGRFFWTPMVDLGGNMGGIFSFYLWGSPFFWLTIPFPESWLPFMMPFLMALKYGTASAAACAWIRTQTKTDLAAVLGAFLYAFSGFQACNIVFQHFHDATAFFPLYLLAFDRFVQGRRKYGFALMTALMSVINYYFFFGQVLFLVLYYMIRRGIRLIRSEGLPVFAGEVLRIVAAGAFGLMLSAFFLVQSIGGIMGNARISKILNGYDLVAYPDAVTPLAILKSFFMIPDLVARGTLFTSDYVKNGSLAFYLPCFAMTGVFAFWMMRRLSWKKTLLQVLLVMAFVPALNASFSAFNANYYARWFYMPLLLCACMTAEVMEKEDTAALTRGGLLNLGITVLFLLMCFLPVEDNGKWSFTAVCNNRKLLTTQIYGTLFGMAVLCVILVLKRRLRNKAKTVRIICLVLTIVCCISSTIAVLHNGSSLIAYTGFEKWKKQMLTQKPVLERRMEDYPLVTNWDEGMPVPAGQGGKPLSVGGKGLTLPAEESREPLSGDAPFSRVETDSTSTNYELVWGIPTMHCFESTVHPSIFKWYRGIGMIRTVESTLPMERIGARAVMSVRYYLENALVKHDKSYTDQGGIQGYALINEENGYNVYETANYIPMGFSFDSYITEENYKKLPNGVVSDRVLVKDLILSEEMAQKYGSLMEEDTDTDPGEMPYLEFTDHCYDRAASACTSFSFDKNGFHAEAEMDKDNLLLFSIPYDKGFTARVDGVKAEVERADYGLTAIFVPEGRHQIRVTYRPPGLIPCTVLSLLAFILLAADWRRNMRRSWSRT